MANKIILKKSSVVAKVPLAADLEIGEISVNLADQKLYSKNASGTVILVGSSATGAGTVTSVSGAGTVSGLTLTGNVTSSGSLTLGGAISTLNQSTTGNAATVTTNANLTGHITSVGNAAVLGSFTSAQLSGALSDETGTGAAVFATSPTLVTPLSNSLSAVPVGSGAGNSLTIAAGSGVTSGAGANLILNPGEQATTGGRGTVLIDGLNAGKSKSAGVDNTVFGVGALGAITTGYWNVAVGNNALAENTIGADNIAIGLNAIKNSIGFSYSNIAIGSNALNSLGTYNYNVAIGVECLKGTTGSRNIAIGGFTCAQTNSGSGSIYIGVEAGRITNANNNVVIGNSAGYWGTVLTSGASNVLVGAYTEMGTGNAAASNCIVIGASAIGNGANTTTIGNSSTTATYLYGTIAAIPVTSGAGNSLTIAAGSGVTSGAGGSLILQAGIQATSGGDGKVIVKQVAGQTGNYFELQTSGGLLAASIEKKSALLLINRDSTYSPPTFIALQPSTGGENCRIIAGANSGNHGLDIMGGALNGGTSLATSNIIPTYASFNADGRVGIALSNPSARFHVVGRFNGGASDTKIMIVQAGSATQANNLQEWQNSAGTVLASVDAAGKVNSNALAAIPVASGAGNSLTIAAGSGVGATGTNNGANLILNPGEFATSGTRGTVLIDGLTVGKGKGTAGGENANTVFGFEALGSITTGYNNTAIGHQALKSNIGQSMQTAIGWNALKLNNGGSNTAVGDRALGSSVGGYGNTAVGLLALKNSESSLNVAIGLYSAVNCGGHYNTAIGSYSGFTGVGNLETGIGNILIGYSAGMGSGNSAATNSIVIGYNGVGNGTNTTTIGNSSTTATYLYGTIAAIPVTSGAGNSLTIAAGSGVGTTGNNNGADLVLNPGEFANSGTRGMVLIDGLTVGKGKGGIATNTVVGAGALASITTGFENTAFGGNALPLNSTGNYNSAFGRFALNTNVSGHENTAIGAYALYNTTGSYNCSIGVDAGNSITTGSYNVAIGRTAGKTGVGNLTTGSSNTLLGSFTGMGSGNSAASNCIVIGANAIGNGSNTTTIGNTSTTFTYLHGTIAAVPVASGAGNSLTIAAGSGVTSGAGGSLILQAGIQATTGGDGSVVIKQLAGQSETTLLRVQSSSNVDLYRFDYSSSSNKALSIGIPTTLGSNGSLQVGFNTVSGSYSTVIGSNTVGGSYSTVIGYLAINSGSSGVSVGRMANSGEQGVAVGSSSTSGGGGVAIGYVSSATTGVAMGNFAVAGGGIAIGIGAVGSSGSSSCVQIGNSSVGTSQLGVAIGHSSSLQHDSIAIGSYANTSTNTAYGSIALGHYAKATAQNQFVIKAAPRNNYSTFSYQEIAWQLGILSTLEDYLTSKARHEWAVFDTATRTGRSIFYTYYTTTAQEGIRIQSAVDQARVAIGGNVVSGTRTVVYTGLAAEKGLVIQGAASQTANLQEWQNSAGTVLASVDAAGKVNSNALAAIPVTSGAGNSLTIAAGSGVTSGAGGSLILQAGIQATTGGDGRIILRRAAGQTSNLLEFQTSAGLNSGSIDQNGCLILMNRNNSSLSGIALVPSAGGANNRIVSMFGGGNGGFDFYGGAFNGSSQIEGSNITPLYMSISQGGNVAIGGFSTPSARLHVMGSYNGSPSNTKIVIVQGMTGQTENLQEWQNSAGTALAFMDASGNFNAITKSFNIPHPTKEGGRLRYASLEGPENSVYVRGSIKGVNEVIIYLPEYWPTLVHEDSLTVQTTAVGFAQPTLFVKEKSSSHIVISADGPISVDYMICAERRDVSKLEVES